MAAPWDLTVNGEPVEELMQLFEWLGIHGRSVIVGELTAEAALKAFLGMNRREIPPKLAAEIDTYLGGHFD